MMKLIDWNTASELGLVQRINKEILHPLGLAMSRDPKTGHSTHILVADDKHFEFSTKIVMKPILSNSEVHEIIDQIPTK